MESTTNQTESLNEPCTADTEQDQRDKAKLIKERLDGYFHLNQNRQSFQLTEVLAEFKNADGIVVIRDYQFAQYGVFTFANFANCEFVRCDFSHMTIHSWNCELATFIDCKFDNSLVIAHDRLVARDLPAQLTKVVTRNTQHTEWHWYDRETDTFLTPFENNELSVHFRNQTNYLCNLPAFVSKYDYHSIKELAENAINDYWLHACDPITLIISHAFYQFANFGIRANQPSYTNDEKSLGWKLHISVDPEKLAQAFNLLFPKLIKHFRSFKVINPAIFTDKTVTGRLRTFAQITVYLYDHPSHQPILPVDDLKKIISDIVATLRSAGIQSGRLTESDARLQIDGELIDYVTMRNDRVLNVAHSYLSAKAAGRCYNPANHYNPYRDLIWHYQPYCAEIAFKQMQFHISKSVDAAHKTRSKLWYSLAVIFIGMLREYMSETTITSLFQDTLFGATPSWLDMREFHLTLFLLATDSTYLLTKFNTENLEKDKIENLQAILLLIAYWIKLDEEADFTQSPQVSSLNFDSHRIPTSLKHTLKRIQEFAATAEQKVQTLEDNAKKSNSESLMAFFYSNLNLSKLFDTHTDNVDLHIPRVSLAIDLCQDLTNHYLDEAWTETALLQFLTIIISYFNLSEIHRDFIEDTLVARFKEQAPIILASFYLSTAINSHDEDNDEKAQEFLTKSQSFIEKFKLQEIKHPLYQHLLSKIEQQLKVFKFSMLSDSSFESSEDATSDSFTYSPDSSSKLYLFWNFQPTRSPQITPIIDDSSIILTDNSEEDINPIESKTYRRLQQ